MEKLINILLVGIVGGTVGSILVLQLTGNLNGSQQQEQPKKTEAAVSTELEPNPYSELVGLPAEVPRTVCSIYDINPFSKLLRECGLQYIDTKLQDRVRLQNKFPDAEHMRVTPAEELASRCLNDGLVGDEWLDAKCPEAMLELAELYGVAFHENELSGRPTD